MSVILAALLLLQDADPDQLVRRLGSDDIGERDRATAALQSLGAKAIPALLRASSSEDPEIKGRARGLLQPIRDREARDFLVDLERRIQATPGFRIGMTVRLEGPGDKDVVTGKGELLGKTGRKVFTSLQRTTSKVQGERILVSNGEDLATRREMVSWNLRSAPSGLDRKLVSAFVRSGLSYWWFRSDGFMTRDPGAVYDLVDVKAQDPDGESAVLTYRMSDRETVNTLDVRLWYDPKTGRPLRRSFRGVLFPMRELDEERSRPWTWTEQYEEFDLNALISDEQFRLPEAGK
ncbi:MAG TPA: hypothetical protein VE981_12410 [Planctomycetota bacterium]|nr:hypothetical protein [Planctomycetota bacterium]